MQQALTMMAGIEERLAEAGLEAKGKLNSWLEGGFEHLGLVQGIEHFLERVESGKQNVEDLRDVIKQAGSVRDVLMRVFTVIPMYLYYTL